MRVRFWEGVVWCFAIVFGLFTATATLSGFGGGGWEAGFDGDEASPWWEWAVFTAGFAFWALQLRKRRSRWVPAVLAELNLAGCVPIATVRERHLGRDRVRVCGLVTEIIAPDGSPDCYVEDTTGALRLSMPATFWRPRRDATLSALVVAIDGTIEEFAGEPVGADTRRLSPSSITPLSVPGIRNRLWVNLDR